MQSNVIPPEFTFSIDCRVALSVDLEEFEKKVEEWCEEAGEGVWVDYTHKQPHVPATKLDESNPYWIALKKAADNM